ncbi:MAG: hypothetical protein C5B51_17750 [Terriglobia bacterium]|nr:MAG: hypothetical protein C5B51_17750 [Terriglobia bacterium]
MPQQIQAARDLSISAHQRVRRLLNSARYGLKQLQPFLLEPPRVIGAIQVKRFPKLDLQARGIARTPRRQDAGSLVSGRHRKEIWYRHQSFSSVDFSRNS